MKKNVREPVLVLANGVGLWRVRNETGELAYAAFKKEADGTETMVVMASSDWELFVRALETDAITERQREMDERFNR